MVPRTGSRCVARRDPALGALLAVALLAPLSASQATQEVGAFAVRFDAPAFESGFTGTLFVAFAEQGEPRSQNNLGMSYLQGAGVAKDPRTAAEWFEKAAAQGVVQAQFSLGAAYARGDGVPRDLVRSYAWFEICAARGFPRAAAARAQVAQGLSPAQLDRARALARELSRDMPKTR